MTTESDISEVPNTAMRETLYPFQFDGKGGEYFRIWIVNIALSIITLGIYSAWATVRTRRYFYGKTSLDGTPFQYTAKPIPILIGRIIALVIFLIYVALGSINPTWGAAYFLLIILPLAPWMIMKSLQFRARYTKWRNIPLKFTGGYWRAAYVFGFLPLTIPLTLTFTTPWFWQGNAAYQLGNVEYGKLASRFNKDGKGFWSTYGWVALAILALFGGFILFGSALASVGALIFGDQPNFENTSDPLAVLFSGAFIIFALLIYIPAFCITFFVEGRLFNASLGNTIFGTPLRPIKIKPRMPILGFIGIRLSNVIMLILTLGFFWPWAKVRETRYKLQNLAIITTKPLEVEAAEASEDVGATGAELASDFGFDISLF